MSNEQRDEPKSAASSRFKSNLKPLAQNQEPAPQSIRHDPLVAARVQAPAFNNAWLKSGESMTLLQRTGFAIFSLIFLLFGIWLIQGAIVSFRENDVYGLFFVAASIILITTAGLGAPVWHRGNSVCPATASKSSIVHKSASPFKKELS